ncbi:cuticle protein, partial [Aethina tumida]|uniref:cuticle protein n=1 Tax=Aethina tumida TaxID=116153 RepID=UPI0021480D2E
YDPVESALHFHLINSFRIFQATISICFQLIPAEDSYSFHKFSGPVSGEVTQVVVPGNHHESHGSKIDYVAKPDYAYSYGVLDDKTGNSQTHTESRDGDAVTGEYRVLQADGVVRIVKYTADADSGFQATVEYADVNQDES